MPIAIDGFGGFTVIEDKARLLTVMVADPDTEPKTAEIVDVPAATAIPTAGLPPLAMVATAVFEDDHCTDVVMSWVVPSLNVPVAVNAAAVPCGTVGASGEQTRETNVAEVAVRVAEPLTLAAVAEIVDGPGAVAVASPVALMVALLDALHEAELVRSSVLPSA